MKLNLRGAAITLLLLWSLPIIVHATDDGLVGRVVQRYTSLENYYVRGTFFFAAGFGEMSQQFEAPFIQAGSAPGKTTAGDRRRTTGQRHCQRRRADVDLLQIVGPI